MSFEVSIDHRMGDRRIELAFASGFQTSARYQLRG